ncbi:AGC/PKA protein kinase [Microbotryum lychnidis-dioicae p1A1 Lamole]|uniref:cAMP-dependent protein kinase n=1 Tax=Microbotryum lychnidis-dioicae (strain p1A1 Lamole / MvSl-1064) TaxID=683840 RepID=U5HGX8_USTV1|nr:AGC/PKA protein kinase [Microbotryum lychnidis-dioicae p1A1 Lamole]|eukprot:KDE03170.1 AGC/PKA protein kinase [Microbotryum lychnidis-dioicae p1A1 Lamole]
MESTPTHAILAPTESSSHLTMMQTTTTRPHATSGKRVRGESIELAARKSKSPTRSSVPPPPPPPYRGAELVPVADASSSASSSCDASTSNNTIDSALAAVSSLSSASFILQDPHSGNIDVELNSTTFSPYHHANPNAAPPHQVALGISAPLSSTLELGPGPGAADLSTATATTGLGFSPTNSTNHLYFPLQPQHPPQDQHHMSPQLTGLQIGSPPLIPSPTLVGQALPSVAASAFHHLSQQKQGSQQHVLPPPSQHNSAIPSPSAMSMTSSLNYTPALSAGTMSASSSQDGFRVASHSPIMAYPTTPQMMAGLGMPGAFFQNLPGGATTMHKQTSSGSHRIYMNPSSAGKAASTLSAQNSPRPPSTSNQSPASLWGPMPAAMPVESSLLASGKNRTVMLPTPVPTVEATPSRKGEEIGLDLGDFDMLDTLGTGTFGRVILAQLRPAPCRPAQTQPHYFAMKVLEKVTVVRLRQIEHLNSERATLAQVSHPFIVNLFCTFQDEQNLYLLLEYVQGGELFSHLRRAGRFSADVARFYAANLILALEYLHKKDIIYRDLKPENLLIDSTGYLKITDFGFAKHVRDRTYTLCGTPEYLAPEIIMATGHGPAADWWALGVLIFELLAGYPPFFADNPLETYERILQNKFSFPAHIDRNARDLIKHLLTPDLSKRLGNLVHGASDVKRHPWFEGVEWDAVETKQIRAPIIPHASGPSDTSNFERYPPSSIDTLPAVKRAAQARRFNTIPELLPHGDDPYGYLFPAF